MTHNTRTQRRWSLLLGVVSLFLLAALATAGTALADDPAERATAPWIASDKPDYGPGELVTLTGGSWQPGESVHVNVNDDEGQSWIRDVDVTADETGNISDSFSLPNWFIATYSVRATGASGAAASTSFTDGTVTVVSAGTAVQFQLSYRPNFDSLADCQAGTTNTAVTVGNSPAVSIGVGNGKWARLDAAATAVAGTGGAFSGWSSTDTSPFAFTVVGGTGNRVICVAGDNAVHGFKASYASAVTTTSVGSIAAAASTFGGTTNLSATVSPAGAPGSVAFFLAGSATAAAGSVSYNASTGLATLSSFAHGLNASATAYSVRAVFTSS